VQRLKTRTQFQAVLAGNTIARTAHFALHCTALDVFAPVLALPPPAQSKALSKALFDVQDVWVGAMVPKRWAKRAVTRNAIKRQIYNVSSQLEPALPCAAHVVRLRAGFDKVQVASATSDLLKAAVRVELNQLFAKVRPATAKVVPAPVKLAAP
jgi:ribonuclease P protein component